MLEWLTTIMAGKATLKNIFELLTKVSQIVTGLEGRLASIEQRLNQLELGRALDKVAESSPVLKDMLKDRQEESQ